MLKIIAIAAIVIVVLVVIVLVVAATRPNDFRVERSATIAAPPEEVYAMIADFHQWPAWSPYEKLDPAMKKTFSGATSGEGAVYEWEGNSQAGSGRIEIIEAQAPNQLTMTLNMIKPFNCHNEVVFTIARQGESKNVTWAMQGQQPFIGKVMSLFMNMDKMVGGQFEEGLANLKAVTENNVVRSPRERKNDDVSA